MSFKAFCVKIFETASPSFVILFQPGKMAKVLTRICLPIKILYFLPTEDFKTV